MLRVKNAQARLPKPADTPAPTPGLYMERSQSRISLSASFEALAIYFPCMNSFDEDDGGESMYRTGFIFQVWSSGGGCWLMGKGQVMGYGFQPRQVAFNHLFQALHVTLDKCQ